MRNIRLTLAYDGTNYVGWQVQPNGTSVQSVVSNAIERLTGVSPNLLAAGRTDSGVHAIGQVANFHTECAIPCDKMRAGLQSLLPDDVVVREVADADDAFHATYSARKKRYRYIIHNSHVSVPFTRQYAWRVGAPLDHAAMHAAAQVLLGTHDFRCFESQFPNKATSVRTVFETTVARTDVWQMWNAADVPSAPPTSGAGDYIWLDIVADGFLYNMVRAIVGTLVKVGLGKWTAADVASIIERQDRALAGETAPAHGLYLMQVDYDDAR